jgi:hypothetical protein
MDPNPDRDGPVDFQRQSAKGCVTLSSTRAVHASAWRRQQAVHSSSVNGAVPSVLAWHVDIGGTSLMRSSNVRERHYVRVTRRRQQEC